MSAGSARRTTVNRRRFLKAAAGAAAGAAALSPLAGASGPFIHGEDKAGAKLPVVGTGEHTYECLHDWGMDSLPAGAHYGNASHGVTIDSQGLIYITHYGDPGSIFVFDPEGRFVRSMGDFHQLGDDGKRTARGHGIDIRREGSDEFLYLSASDATLDFAKIDLRGELVWRIGRERLQEESGRYPQGAAYRPTNTSFSPDGGFFLGDGYGSSLIHQFDAERRYLRTIGGTGTADGQFRTPHGQWLDTRGEQPLLVVADRANARLQWFDMEGKHVRTLGGFLFPADIDAQGDVLLVPDLHCRVTLLDKQNEVIVHLGDDPEWRAVALEGFKMRGQRPQWRPGRFVHPHDACFDRDGNIFVTEWVATGRVTKLRKV